MEECGEPVAPPRGPGVLSRDPLRPPSTSAEELQKWRCAASPQRRRADLEL